MNFTRFVLLVLATAAISWLPARGADPALKDIPPSASMAVRNLIEKTFSPNVVTRAKAAQELVSIGPAASCASPFLVRLLSDEAEVEVHGEETPARVFSLASEALVKIGTPAVAPCITALKEASGPKRQSLIDVLCRIADPTAIETLIRMIDDPDDNTSRSAITSLWLWKASDSRLVMPLVGALKDRSNADVRLAAAACLENVRDPRALDALLAAMRDKDLHIRETCVHSLGRQGDRRAVPALIDVLRHPSSENSAFRTEAARALGEIGDRRAVAPLLAVLKEGREHDLRRSVAVTWRDLERSAAAKSIGLLGSREALPAVRVVAHDQTECALVRTAAIHAMARLDGSGSVPLLVQLAKSQNEPGIVAFWAAMEVLTITDGAIDDVAILGALTRAYIDSEPAVEGEGGLSRRLEQRQAVLKRVVARGNNEAVRDQAAKLLADNEKIQRHIGLKARHPRSP